MKNICKKEKISFLLVKVILRESIAIDSIYVVQLYTIIVCIICVYVHYFICFYLCVVYDHRLAIVNV